ncbi:MAG: diguanylate cyclase, partial [Mogibacterium sp.]|nr:diguanylate cyclase [Mogibacterium sp.]
MLVKVANAIRDSFRAHDYVCRLGGDEFAVILQNIDTVSVSTVAKKIDVINEKLADTSDGLPEIHISAGISLGH